MDFSQIVRTRRSIRKYRPDPVPAEVLRRVLEAARIAPWGAASKVGPPTRLIVVEDEATRQKLVPLLHNQHFIARAPVVVVACVRDIGWNRGGWMERYAKIVDGSIVLDHLLLAARAEGLGTCWIGSFDNAGLKRFFSLPDDWDIVGLTPVGYPDGDLFGEPGERLPFEEFVRWEKW